MLVFRWCRPSFRSMPTATVRRGSTGPRGSVGTHLDEALIWVLSDWHKPLRRSPSACSERTTVGAMFSAGLQLRLVFGRRGWVLCEHAVRVGSRPERNDPHSFGACRRRSLRGYDGSEGSVGKVTASRGFGCLQLGKGPSAFAVGKLRGIENKGARPRRRQHKNLLLSIRHRGGLRPCHSVSGPDDAAVMVPAHPTLFARSMPTATGRGATTDPDRSFGFDLDETRL